MREIYQEEVREVRMLALGKLPLMMSGDDFLDHLKRKNAIS